MRFEKIANFSRIGEVDSLTNSYEIFKIVALVDWEIPVEVSRAILIALST